MKESKARAMVIIANGDGRNKVRKHVIKRPVLDPKLYVQMGLFSLF